MYVCMYVCMCVCLFIIIVFVVYWFAVLSICIHSHIHACCVYTCRRICTSACTSGFTLRSVIAWYWVVRLYLCMHGLRYSIHITRWIRVPTIWYYCFSIIALFFAISASRSKSFSKMTMSCLHVSCFIFLLHP